MCTSLQCSREANRPPADFTHAGPKNVGLLTQLPMVSRPVSFKRPDGTFFGTRSLASKNVCHEGRLLAFR